MNQFWKRSTAVAVLSASILVSTGGVDVQSAHAAPPTGGQMALQPIGTIQTSPFLGVSPPVRPGDIEDLAYDPVRKSLWMPDDSKSRLYEVEFGTNGAFESGRLLSTITRDQLAAAPQYLNPGVLAGTIHAADLEAMAYDPIADVMYAFAGPCCTGLQKPAVFRLNRPGGPGTALKVLDFQELTDPIHDFSGVGVVVNGGVAEIWAGYQHNLYRYHYVAEGLHPANSFEAASVALPLYQLGYINGVSFSDDGKQVWVTTDNERIIRYAWPVPQGFPNNQAAPTNDQMDPRVLGIPDTRAIALVGSKLAVADGYDFYPIHGIQEFQIHVYEVTALPPIASFTAAPTTVGAGGTVSFQDTSTRRPTSVTWDFGDGSAAVTVATPDLLPPPVTPPPNPRPPYVPYAPAPVTHKYTAVGPHTVTLVAHNANAPFDSAITAVITVNAGPAADFTMTPSTGPAPLTVNFADNSTQGTAPTSWAWDFGDGATGSTSTAQNPTYVYQKSGVYTVTFTASNAQGSSTITKQVTVTGPPSANFSIDAPGGVAPVTVGFTNLSIGVPDITAYKWDFGDGTTSTRSSDSHLYLKGGQFIVTLTVTNANGSASISKPVTVASGTRFIGVNPARLMDTRQSSTIDNRFSGEGPIGPNAVRTLTVTGRGDSVPATGIGAVALNVTAIGPTAASYLTVWPTGAERPNASNLNFVADQTIPNMVIVPVGANGQIDIYNESGTVNVAVDILGFFPVGPSFNGITPERFMDTRAGGNTKDHQFQAGGPLGAGAINLKIAGRNGVPGGGVAGSVALNVTVVNPTDISYLTVWAKGTTQPNASNLNFAPGTTIPNMVIVPMSGSGEISIFNSLGTTDVIVDVLGWFPAGSSDALRGLTPSRVFDSRQPGGRTEDGAYAAGGVLGAGQQVTFKILGRGGVPTGGIGSVALNVTAVGPTAESYLTVWPGGTPQPNASNLNYVAGTIIPNMVIVPVGPKGEIGLFNAFGSTDVIVDVLGYFPG